MNIEKAKEFFLKGLDNFSKKNYKMAEIEFQKSLLEAPNRLSVLINLSATQIKLKKFKEAKKIINNILLVEKDNIEAILNLGIIYKEEKNLIKSLELFEKIINLNGNYQEALLNKGIILNQLGRVDEAISYFNQSLKVNPVYAEALLCKGESFAQLKKYQQALANYNKAYKLNPNIDWIVGDIIHTEMQICEWDRYENDDVKKNILNVIKKNKIAPYFLISLIDDPVLHKIAAVDLINEFYVLKNNYQNNFLKRDNKKLKICYLSSDFYNHATSYLIAELIELHDRKKFEIIGVSLKSDIDDEMHLRLKNAFDKFINVSNESDPEIIKLIQGLEIDIAVDLKGHTQNNRISIFCNRIAPIQINYLGYPGTSGVANIDYIIADKIIIPEGNQNDFLEKIIYLPHCYQINDTKKAFLDLEKKSKKDFGLPEDKFIYCSFNNNYKILPDMFSTWMRILNAVENSVLWLLSDNDYAEKNLIKEAKKRGISESRLFFAKRVNYRLHLSRHSQADLFLDTFPYNAHTTASDALFLGLPVLTILGKSFASRVAASLLNEFNLSELVTRSLMEYENLAIVLGQNKEKLIEIKNKLNQNIQIAKISDAQLFTKNIEQAYLQIYHRFELGLKPTNIYI